MANPRKPTALKLVAGTDRPDRAAPASVALPLAETIPAPPKWIKNSHGKEEFNRLAKILHANKLLTEASLGPLSVLCALHGEIVSIFSKKDTPTGHMLAQYRALVNDFGLTPVAQGKIREGGKKENPGGKFNGIGNR